MFESLRLQRELWEKPGVVFVATFVIYNLVFLHLTLPAYEHHDSYATLGLRAQCTGFDWYGVWSGRPLYSMALCWATMLGDGLALAKAFRIAACLSTAAAAGLFAILLSRYVPRSIAVLFALTAFSLPGVLLAVTMFQATVFAFCYPLLIATGIASALVFRKPPSLRRLLLISGGQFLAILAVLELYQAIVPLIFLPLLTIVFFDQKRVGRAAVVPVIHLAILFVSASVFYLISIKIIHAAVVFPPSISFENRDVAVSLSLGRLIDAVRWIGSAQIDHISRLWFIDNPGVWHYSKPLVLVVVPLAICLRVIDAWRLASAFGRRPVIAAGGVLASTIIVLLAGDYLAFVVKPDDRFLLVFERVKWPFEILLLIPVFYFAFRIITWWRLGARMRLLGAAVVAALAVTAIVSTQDLILRGRVLLGATEREFTLAEIRRQLAVGKDGREIGVITSLASRNPRQLNDELFLLTSIAQTDSLRGMMMVLGRELGLDTKRVHVVDANNAHEHEALEELARSRNVILVDYRQFPATTGTPASQIEKAVPIRSLITCQMTIDAKLIGSGGNLPVMMVGDPNRAELFFLRKEGEKIVMGIDHWNVSHKETTLDPGALEKQTIEMKVDYARDTASVTVGGNEVLRSVGGLSSWQSSRDVVLGSNRFKYPGMAESFPEVARMAASGAAACDVSDAPSEGARK